MSDEPRLNRIEAKLDKVVIDSSEFRGELRQFMANSDSFVKAVSDLLSRELRTNLCHAWNGRPHGNLCQAWV